MLIASRLIFFFPGGTAGSCAEALTVSGSVAASLLAVKIAPSDMLNALSRQTKRSEAELTIQQGVRLPQSYCSGRGGVIRFVVVY